MGWRQRVLGSDASSRTRMVLLDGFAFVMAWLFYSAWIEFESASWVATYGFYASAGVGVAVAAWVAWINLTGRNPRFSGSRAGVILASPVLALLLAGLIWLAVTEGMAGAFTRVAGVPASTAVTFDTERNLRGRLTCPYRAFGYVDGHSSLFHVCISEAYYLQHPDHRVEMSLVGYRSALGFYVTGTEHRRDLGHRGY